MKRRAALYNTINMTTLNKTLGCAFLGASVALSACGGGGNGDDGSGNAARNSAAPASGRGSVGLTPASSSGASETAASGPAWIPTPGACQIFCVPRS
ncbi:hypothetical protein B0G73_1051 [Paraburkholderia sp. BL25I1N1]|nr:hypothetical protein B0G73_1051 [Paraburkholderia sp. BL25I1N1]